MLKMIKIFKRSNKQEMLNFIDDMHLTPEQIEYLKENKKSNFYAKLCGMNTRVKVFNDMFSQKNPIYQE